MSNSVVGRILTHQALVRTLAVQKQSKAPHAASANSCAVPSASKAENAASHNTTKLLLSTGFLGKTHTARQGIKQCSKTNMIPHAAFVDHSSAYGRKFRLADNSELEVKVYEPASGPVLTIEMQVTNYNGYLVLHWGAIRQNNDEWTLPSRRPDGTTTFNEQALRTPFAKSGSTSSVKVEIDDHEIDALEFLVVDEGEDRWYRDNDQNFKIQLPLRRGIPVPEELVQIQAYHRWQKKGRPTYTRDQERREHGAARTELIEELRRGTSLEELGSKLITPDDVANIMLCIRWKNAGKPTYSLDEQHREVEAARNDLQHRLDQGNSLYEIMEMIVKGSRPGKGSKQGQTKNSSIGGRKIENRVPHLPVLKLWSKAITEQDGGSIVSERKFKLGDKTMQAVVSKPSGRTKVYLATDLAGPLTLHWALSRKSGEWLVPPSSAAPSGSVMLDGACQTPFVDASFGDMQTILIEIDGGDYTGLPFVLLSDGDWINDNGMDFNIALN